MLMEVTVKMFQKRLRQVSTALIAAMMLLSTLTAMAPPAVMAAPAAADVLTSDAVGGLLPGGQFSKTWLKITPNGNGDVVILTEWDHTAPEGQGLGFYILDKNGLASVLNGSKRPAQANLTAGSRPSANAPDNQLGAVVHPEVGEMTIVLYNDSPSDANFTLKTTNATISDDSNQVHDLKAAPTAASGSAVTGTVESKTETPVPAATTTTTATATSVATTTATTAPAATSTPEPAASATTSSTLPSNVKVAGNVVTSPVMEGSLPTQNTQHYFALVPDEKNGAVSLTLSYDPQDSTELARRLNFWVLDPDGFKRYTDASVNVVLSEIAIAAGSGAPGLSPNQRQAKFTASGFGPYTVIVYNNSTVPATYKLVAGGATMTDDSQQSTTAQQAVNGGGTTSASATAVTTESGSTAAPAATTASAGSTTESTRQGEPGGTYTVKSGDTISLIARDIYGNINAWEALCKFNALTDCNAIEVGQVLKLPTKDQVSSGATPAATKAAVAAATATPAAAAGALGAAATTAATATTTATTETAATETPEAVTTPKASATVSTTTGVTNTASPSETGTTTSTKSTAAKGSVNLIQALEAQGSFTTLVQALEAANLTAALEGAGPFTIFAPTDAAFASLPSGALDQLLANPTGQLTQILLFHVLPGTVTSTDIQNGMQATTQQGKAVGFEVGSDGTIKINGAHVDSPEIDASNGVIHPIDTVILPPPE